MTSFPVEKPVELVSEADVVSSFENCGASGRFVFSEHPLSPESSGISFFEDEGEIVFSQDGVGLWFCSFGGT